LRECCNFWFIKEYASAIFSCSTAWMTIIYFSIKGLALIVTDNTCIASLQSTSIFLLNVSHDEIWIKSVQHTMPIENLKMNYLIIVYLLQIELKKQQNYHSQNENIQLHIQN
jgi:hypothetical protein